MNSEPKPTPNDQPHIADLVCEDIQKRKEMGTKKYGTALQAFNTRCSLQDMYEEDLDRLHYWKQNLLEEKQGFLALWNNVGEWSDSTFGTRESGRGPIGPLKHFAKELLVELLGLPEGPVMNLLNAHLPAMADGKCNDIKEYADLTILLCDCARRAGIDPWKLLIASHDKMAVNRQRNYPKPTGNEISEHDRSKDKCVISLPSNESVSSVGSDSKTLPTDGTKKKSNLPKQNDPYN